MSDFLQTGLVVLGFFAIMSVLLICMSVTCRRDTSSTLQIYWVSRDSTHYHIMAYVNDWDEYTDEGSLKTPTSIFKTKSKKLAKDKLFKLYLDQQ